MREHYLQPARRRRYVATTDSDHEELIFRNLSKDTVLDPSRVVAPVFRSSSHQLPSGAWKTVRECGRAHRSQRPLARSKRIKAESCGQSIG